MAQSKSLNLLWLSLGLSHASSGFIPDSHASSGFTCLEVLKSVTPSEVNSTIGETAELNATITSLTNRYDRIYPELNLSGMDPKLRKLTTRALVAIDLKSAGRELTPEHFLQLRNLLSRFKGSPSLENLSASYIGSLARGDLEEARREAVVLLGHLQAHELQGAEKFYGVFSEASPIWSTLAKVHPAVFERIKVKDVNGKEHDLFVLLGHPENATSTLQRFHQVLRNRYGSELYINDDLVPSALGFYQQVGNGGKDGLSYIILRSENLKQDYLDFVGYHEGRHVMFKTARNRMKSVAAVEVQIRANEGKELPPWYEKDLLVPTAENEELRAKHARENNSYKNFMTFEENYNHVKDLQYAVRLKHQAVLDLYEMNGTLPPNRLFDLQLVNSKIDLLNEITFKTKNAALEARLYFEKQVKNLEKDLSGAQARIELLDGLRSESLELKVNEKYSMKIDFSTPEERQMAEDLLLKYRRLQGIGNAAEKELLDELARFQESLSERLIESYDFALEIKIQLANLSDRYAAITHKPGITRDEYLDFRRELFNQGRNAKKMLFKEANPEDDSNPPGP